MNITATTISQLLDSVSAQAPAMPQTSQKHEPSSFERLMQDKYREAPSGGEAAETAHGSKVPSDGGEPAQGAEQGALEEQYVWAAALSAPMAGIFMQNPIIVDAQAEALPMVSAKVHTLAGEPQAPETQIMAQTSDAKGMTIVQTPKQAVQTEQTMPQTGHTAQSQTLAAHSPAGDAAEGIKPVQAETQEQPEILTLEVGQRPVFDKVQSVPVKVGEAQDTPMDAEAPDLDAQLAARLRGAMQNGDSHIRVALSPENLGTMQVQLTRGSDGSLSVVLSASTEKAFSLLERHSAGLQSLLMTSAQAPVKIEVQHSGEGQQTQGAPLNPDDGSSGQKQQHSGRHDAREQSIDFMQQLRLGLIDLGEGDGKEVS